MDSIIKDEILQADESSSPMVMYGIAVAIAVSLVGTAYWYFGTSSSYSPPIIKQDDKSKPSPTTPKNVPQKLATIPKKKSRTVLDENLPHITIFFGSQTGTAEDFSHKLATEAKRYKIESSVVDLEEYDTADLEKEKFVIFCVATYGEGEPTDNAKEFYGWLMDESREPDLLKNVKFTVFGLGNNTYEQYNAMGKKFDARLEQLGATRVYKRGEGDDDSSLEDDFATWKKDLWPAVCSQFGIDASSAGEDVVGERRFKVIFKEQDASQSKKLSHLAMAKLSLKRSLNDSSSYDIKNPYLGKIVVNKELHAPNSDRSCKHIEIYVGNDLSYEVGDHLGIYPENDPTLVEEVAVRLKVNLDTVFVMVPKDADESKAILGPCTVRQALLQWTDLTSTPRKGVLKVLAQYATDNSQREKLLLLSDDTKPQPYQKFIKDDQRTILEVLNEFASVSIPFDHFLEIVPRLPPRYYSISSSLKAHPGYVHITAVVIDYITPTNRRHKGVATNYFAKLDTSAGQTYPVPIFVQKANFRLPRNPSVPVVMIGPGTGLAPFRGFIQERKIQKQKTNTEHANLLFFGCRSSRLDYIYKEELELHHSEGHIVLHVAFSRENPGKKVYVQHKLLECPDLVWNLINEKKGYLYICGDARAMAKDVHQALRDIIIKCGGKTEAEAEKYLTDLQKSGRYLTDVWF